MSRLRSRPVLARVLANSGWLMGEQVIRLTVGFFLGVWTARHLGPESFGLLSYALAYGGIFAVVATLGLNRILVRELVATGGDTQRSAALLSTAFTLRAIAAAVLYTAAMVGCWISDDKTLLITALVAGGAIFGAIDCVDLFFQSRVESRHAARARLVAFIFSSSLRIVLLINDSPVLAFAAITLVEAVVTFALLQVIYRGHGPRLQSAAVNPKDARKLLQESAPEILGGLGYMLLLRMDQIMLQHITGPVAAGTFAVATRLTEIWYFVPVAIVASAFPGIVSQREQDAAAYRQRIERLMTGLILLAYGVAIFTSLLVVPLVPTIFGSAYAAASDVLLIQVWCGVFLVYAQTSGAWLMAERKAKQNLYRNVLGLCINFSANWILIPRYGATGAAVGTLLSFACAYFFYDMIAPSMRPMARIKMRALFLLGIFEKLRGHRAA